LESEYLATGLSLCAVERLRESFIAKVKSEHNEKPVENVGRNEVVELLTVAPDSSGRAGESESISERIRSLAFDSMNRKTKPPGSLGMLENLAIRVAALQRTITPSLRRKRICVYAGSHGVCEENVSAYPSEVTRQMVLNFMGGGAAISVLARHGQIDVHVIDAGVVAVWPQELLRNPKFFFRSVRQGTSNFAREPAMSQGECNQAIETGREQTRIALADQIDLLGIGEMGIGNTTAAAVLIAALCGIPPQNVAGRGTGIGDDVLRHKLEVIRTALHKYGPVAIEPAGLYWLQMIGGFEIAAMAGTILEAAHAGLPVVVDGFIATAAAAAAFNIDSNSREVCFFSHRSAERGHSRALELLGAEPLLDLKLRLGEGTGAALAMPILEAAVRILSEMATFESAGISRAIEEKEQAG
jgi:nicotinate-nucleotide--dimethylbenzimidazole phosphoribosyltransferase